MAGGREERIFWVDMAEERREDVGACWVDHLSLLHILRRQVTEMCRFLEFGCRWCTSLAGLHQSRHLVHRKVRSYSVSYVRNKYW